MKPQAVVFFTKMPFIAMTVIEDHLYNHPSL